MYEKSLPDFIMNNSPKTSVMVIENDGDFRELLNGVFERSEHFELVGSFGSIEEFADALIRNRGSESWMPELMVVDVMSSSDPRIEGATFMSALRSEGLNFATLLVVEWLVKASRWGYLGYRSYVTHH